MSEESPIGAVTESVETAVTILQTVIALFLVVVLLLGVVNLVATFVQSALSLELLGYKNAVNLIGTTIDIVLYLFIVIELYRTIIAYVEAKSVVRAVVHAGLIAVVRQIIIFKPADAQNPENALLTGGVYAILLLALLVGFFLVHRESAEDLE